MATVGGTVGPRAARSSDRVVLVRLSQQDTIIALEKLRNYLLSPSHPDGRAKAVYLARTGYSPENWAGWKRTSGNST